MCVLSEINDLKWLEGSEGRSNCSYFSQIPGPQGSNEK